MKWALGVCCWALGLASCGHTAEPAPAAPSTAAETRPASPVPPLPPSREATFTQPFHIPLSLLAASIDAQLPRHETRPRTLLTRSNASPAIEASIEVWRDDVHVQFDGSTLHAEVPLRYAAKFDVRVKNPFGSKWVNVARNADWGTASEPQRVVLRLHTRIEITPHWELHLRTQMEPLEHGPAPTGALCAGGMFKLCVSKASFAPAVRGRLEAEIIPRMKAALEKLDRRLENTVQLRARAERIWAGLTAPRALGIGERFSSLMPRQAALELRSTDEEIVVEPAVFGRMDYHEGKPAPVAAPPLPDRVPLAALPGERTQDTPLFTLDTLL